MSADVALFHNSAGLLCARVLARPPLPEPQSPRRLKPGELHWGAIAIAREHARRDAAEAAAGRPWGCRCSCCRRVLAALAPPVPEASL